MSKIQLNPAWESMDSEKSQWGWETPYADIASAFDSAQFVTAAPGALPAPRFEFSDIESVDKYFIHYHEQVWSPGDESGTELTMILVGKLKSGQWFSLSAWNDYTGWGCQDSATFQIGASEDDVVRYGLDNSERARLGINIDITEGN